MAGLKTIRLPPISGWTCHSPFGVRRFDAAFFLFFLFALTAPSIFPRGAVCLRDKRPNRKTNERKRRQTRRTPRRGCTFRARFGILINRTYEIDIRRNLDHVPLLPARDVESNQLRSPPASRCCGRPNPRIRISKSETNPNPKRHSQFVLRISDLFRISAFVLRICDQAASPRGPANSRAARIGATRKIAKKCRGDLTRGRPQSTFLLTAVTRMHELRRFAIPREAQG